MIQYLGEPSHSEDLPLRSTGMLMNQLMLLKPVSYIFWSPPMLFLYRSTPSMINVIESSRDSTRLDVPEKRDVFWRAGATFKKYRAKCLDGKRMVMWRARVGMTKYTRTCCATPVSRRGRHNCQNVEICVIEPNESWKRIQAQN
jgi:hypothetical protein